MLFNKTPDTPDQTIQRQEMESRLRSINGEKWVKGHKGLLDYQWEYLKQVMGV
jgi:hypothetical protein